MRRSDMHQNLTRPQRTPHRALRIHAVTVAAALVVVLAGCTSGGPAPSADPSGPTGPVSLVGVGCDELVSLDDVRSILNDNVEPVDNFFYPGGSWPLATVGLHQSGALVCEWSDAANQEGDYVALLEVDILPNAADEWSAWHESMTGYYPNASEDGTVLTLCSSSLGGSYLYCKHDVFAGGNWATVSVSNLAQDADTAPIVSTIVEALEGASSPSAEWEPTALAGLPATCEELLPVETIRTVLGVDDMDVREAPLLMPYLHNTGLDAALDCSWSNPYSSALGSPLQVTVLPGAGWAWNDAWAAERPDHSPAHPVEELGDAAFAGCQTVDNPPCFLDVLVDGAWVSLDGRGAVNERTLTELASEALAALGG